MGNKKKKKKKKNKDKIYARIERGVCPQCGGKVDDVKLISCKTCTWFLRNSFGDKGAKNRVIWRGHYSIGDDAQACAQRLSMYQAEEYEAKIERLKRYESEDVCFPEHPPVKEKPKPKPKRKRVAKKPRKKPTEKLVVYDVKPVCKSCGDSVPKLPDGSHSTHCGICWLELTTGKYDNDFDYRRLKSEQCRVVRKGEPMS